MGVMPRRRNYFVKKGFQGAFILKFCIIVFLGALVSTVLLFVFSGNTLTSDFSNSRLVIQSTAKAILPAVLLTNLITLALITLAAAILTLFISHKIAGPLFRLEREMEEIGKGDLTREVVFRHKDQITALADGVNRMAGQLHDKIADIRTALDSLAESLPDSGITSGVKGQLKDVRDKIDAHFQL